MNNPSLVMQKQAALHARRHAAHKRRRVFFLFLLILLGVGFFYIIRQPALRVESVNVNSDGLVDKLQVEDFVSQKLAGYKYFLIPRDSLIFIKKDILQQDVMDAFPRLSGVVVYKSKKMNITITEPVFQSMYCSLDSAGAIVGNCVLLHANGRVGGIAPDYSYAPLFTFYSSSVNPKLGSVIISPDEIARIKGLQNEINSYGMPTYGFVYGNEYDEMLIDTGANFLTLPRIRLLPGAQAVEIHKTLGTAIEDPIVKKLLLEKLLDLEYVDLRFDGQVVYKRKGETIIE